MWPLVLYQSVALYIPRTYYHNISFNRIVFSQIAIFIMKFSLEHHSCAKFICFELLVRSYSLYFNKQSLCFINHIGDMLVYIIWFIFKKCLYFLFYILIKVKIASSLYLKDHYILTCILMKNKIGTFARTISKGKLIVLSRIKNIPSSVLYI